MTSLFQKLKAEYFLRLGLGMMYLYSGFDLFANPQHWYGFVPRWLSQLLLPAISIDLYLKIQGVGEFLIGLVFVIWVVQGLIVRTAAWLAVVEMALIIIFIGVDPITFRDIGLLGAAVALLVILSSKDGPIR